MKYVKALEDVVSTWSRISVHPHRFGGTEFLFGAAEVGHVHTNGMVEICNWFFVMASRKNKKVFSKIYLLCVDGESQSKRRPGGPTLSKTGKTHSPSAAVCRCAHTWKVQWKGLLPQMGMGLGLSPAGNWRTAPHQPRFLRGDISN